jgi:hypothetical protein
MGQRALLEKLTVVLLRKKFHASYEGSVPCSQEPVTGPFRARCGLKKAEVAGIRSEASAQ